jgi:glycosyltransferase involved in cell wall biosynthesis
VPDGDAMNEMKKTQADHVYCVQAVTDGRLALSHDSARRVNVLIVASSLWIGGAETVIRYLAQVIDRKRFNVTVCYLRQRGPIGDELACSGIDIVGISDSPQPKVDYFTFVKLLKVIWARRIDVVHTHTTHGLVDATLCKLLIPRLKVVHTFHFGNYPHTRTRIMWMERLFSRIADRLFSVGEAQRRQIQAVYRLPDRRISTIWNGVALPSDCGVTAFRSKVGAEDRVLIGTIATLIQQKGLSDLLEVAKRIRDSGRKTLFVVVGDGHLRPELEAKRRRLGLDDDVVFTGWVTNAAARALPAFDILFQPSLWEAMSVVVLEAMGAGTPVVATRVGENPKVIEHGVDGLLVQPKDIDGMAAALTHLMDDADLRLRLGRAARAKVEQRFTVAHMTRAYEQAYLDALG